MILREPSLRPGWYPRQKELIEEFLVEFTNNGEDAARAVVAPHAGWYYSGSTAAKAVSSLDRASDTVAVIGGHLPRGMPVLIAPEEGVRTPLGIMEIDRELRDEFARQISYKPDTYQDNTVEVLLPMVHYFFPNAKLLWLRFPADISSFDAGKLLAKTTAALGRRLAVVASTDLTHYGDNYGFCPKGFGKPALDWVRNVNDAGFINAVLDGDSALVLKRAENDQSACSAGAVLGAMGFVSAKGKGAKLLEYSNSADVSEDEIPSSFVGYAAISLA
ncbi:MAG: AmmeMemoRadiSam system protein B [Treponema sp.]|nr:AmmeMemoRadiSam system protein B [Treponema sp.]